MTVLCFLHSMAYVIPHHAQFLQMLTGNRRQLSRAKRRNTSSWKLLAPRYGLLHLENLIRKERETV